MNRFIVTADAEGIPTAQVTLSLLKELAKCIPAEKIGAAFHHATNRVLINLPGWDTPAVQEILDNLTAAAACAREGFATWPGLHLGQSEIQDACVWQASPHS